MKQSNNKKSRDVTAFLYERLSRDDNLEGESYSIGNQKKLLAKVAKEKGYTNLVHFLDDGISGVTMDRPGFVEMICQLEQGKAAAVFVKDLSRLGRNYIEVGRLTEEFFPDHDIRPPPCRCYPKRPPGGYHGSGKILPSAVRPQFSFAPGGKGL